MALTRRKLLTQLGAWRRQRRVPGIEALGSLI